ncbi:exodeoxyribonuclease V subunit beta [Pseudidiomarina woesei]|uniref:RecBCD enzyme subunit RecB n=1 Tax=Pseudidiomarina woesei TaxID=1381080 RepID=A0A0K6H465_9GAMM|nr:exodeoxyribonuclease V subunit beta [Pseudidiomarina woesei]CUA85601.1 DNA helicase/exodeoxyribonuclease V, beta subunit [Pseudidiomarina woesei]
MSNGPTAVMNILQPLTFPLHNSRLIEASAGTGKTYTIAALYLRLVLGHKTPRCYKPDELLVVTFTEPATEELRDRIRANLSEAAAYFRGDISVKDPFLIDLKAEFPVTEHPHCGRLLDLAAQAMDEAAVHTIHGWCNRMLREHAFASGSLFTQQLNTDTAAMWEQVSHDYWRTFVSVLSESELTQYQVICDAFASPEALLQSARGIVSYAAEQTTVAPAEVLQQQAKAQQQLRDTFHKFDWLQWADECEQLLADLRDSKQLNGQKLRADSVSKWFDQIRGWAEQLANANAPLLPALQPDSGWLKLSPQDLAENSLKTALPEHPFWQTLMDLKAAADALPAPRVSLLKHAAKWLHQRFAQLQKQRAEMGFDDMLTRLRNALHGDFGDDLAATIRQQFPIAMVDEFQDTDPVQYAIFDRVYCLDNTPEEHGVFLIGDPKQAIYSFRNADIHTYLKARRATTGRHYTLGTNYRSTDAMVAASNALFLQAQEAPRGPFHFRDSDSGDDPLPFLPVQANGLKARWVTQGEEQAALQFDCVEVGSDDKVNNDVLHHQLANWQAERIVQLLHDETTGFVENGTLRRVQPGDIAILVNKASEAKVVREALRQRGLRSVYLSDRDSVFASPVAGQLLQILQACAQPRDPSLLRTALLSQLLYLSLATVDNTLNDELKWDAFAEQVLSYHQRWQRHGVLAVIQRLLHDYDVPAKLLAEADGERKLTDVLHLAELLQQHAATTEGMAGVLRYLQEHIELAQQSNNRTDSQELQVRLESDNQLIQVVTIHKSKGLQYPLVFLPFIANTNQLSNRVTYPAVYHSSSGDIQVAFDDSDAAVAAKIDQERLEEDIRKLYVAVTRAQFATYIGLAPYKTLNDTALSYLLGGGSALDLTQLSLPAHCSRVAVPEVVTSSVYQPPQSNTPSLQFCQIPARPRDEWWVASYSALKYGDWQADTVDAQNALEARYEQPAEQLPEQRQTPQPNSIHSFPKGAEAGTYLHNLLEDAATEGFARLANDTVLRQKFVEQRTQLEPWASNREVLTDWLQALLSVPFKAGDQRLALADLQSYQAEPEFWFPAAHVQVQPLDRQVQQYVLSGYDRPQVLPTQLNGMLKGFIDLVFEYKGRFYVADYKSNYIGHDAAAYTHDAMRDKILASRYDLQYVIYLVALHKLLSVRLGSAYDYDTHIGGAVYLFLRGVHGAQAGAFYDRPPRELIEDLASQFTLKEKLL